MRINVIERTAGSTVKVTWCNTGSVPGQISSALRDRDETLVSSVTASDSGNGFFYAYHTLPTSWGPDITHYWMVQEWRAILNSVPYYDRQFIRAAMPGVS